VTSTT